MKYSTGICANCGADDGLHQAGTDHCPRFGREETREGRYQEWSGTKFEDSGEKRLKEAAPELLEACKILVYELKPLSKGLWNALSAIEHGELAIKKASE